MLTPADLDLHARLGIDAELLEQLHVRRVTDTDARDVLGLNGRPGRLDGVLYPYWVPGLAHPVTHRLRRDHPDIEAGRPKNKYLSAYGDKRHLYFATRDAAVLTDPTIPVVLPEAEKSALAITCAGRRTGRSVLALATGGAYGWRGRIGKTTDANGATVDEVGPLGDFDRLDWTGRDVVLAFDANAASNAKVQQARRALGAELTHRGARVRILALPVEADVNGPDDYIGRHGDADFFALVDGASDAALFDVIFRLNQTHAVVSEGGRTLVLTEDYDHVLHRAVVTRSTFQDFKNLYLNEWVDVGVDATTQKPRRKPLGQVWLAHPDRRQYRGVVMSPGRDVPGYFNLWRGFAVKPSPGSWALLQAHIYAVICGGDDALAAYVLAWLAFGVQHPDRPAEVALVLRGLRGTGKGIFARAYGRLFGQHYLQIAHSKHLVGAFNAHLQDAVVLFADEAFWAGDKAGESVLKMLITERMIPIERKGRDVVLTANLLHIVIASNHEWVIPAGVDERRFCVLDVAPTYQQDVSYFAAIEAELDAGGDAAMLYDLQRYDARGIELRTAPGTEALRQQKVLSLSPTERWLFDTLMSGQLLPADEAWPPFVVKDDLHTEYIRRLQKVGVDRRSTETELGMAIRKYLPGVQTKRRMVNGRQRWCWDLPTLHACRDAFNGVTGSEHPWDRADEDE